MARVIEDRQALTEKAEKILTAIGVTPEDAAKTIDVLVDADMRGIESHGLEIVRRTHCKRFRKTSKRYQSYKKRCYSPGRRG